MKSRNVSILVLIVVCGCAPESPPSVSFLEDSNLLVSLQIGGVNRPVRSFFKAADPRVVMLVPDHEKYALIFSLDGKGQISLVRCADVRPQTGGVLVRLSDLITLQSSRVSLSDWDRTPSVNLTYDGITYVATAERLIRPPGFRD